MSEKKRKYKEEEMQRPEIVPTPLSKHLQLVHCIITEEELFLARVRKWDKRRKLTRLDFY